MVLNKSFWLLLFLIVVSIFVFRLPEIAQFGPYSVHQWRQADCLAFTHNFYENKLPLATPQVMNLLAPDGYSIGEFPALYYLTATLYQVFGYHEVILRIITFGFFLMAVIGSYGFYWELIQKEWQALFISLMVLTSPLLVYYGFNFLANIPALGCSLMGLWMFTKWHLHKQPRHLILATAWVVVGMLFKPIIVFNLFGLLFILLMPKTGVFWNRKYQKQLLIGGVVVIISCLAWQYYVHWFNASKNNTLFLQDILPIWELSYEQLQWCFKALGVRWSTIVLWDFMWPLMACCFLMFCIKYKDMHPYLRQLALGGLIGHTIYMLLYFKNFDVHDYYLINTFSAIIFLVAVIVEYLGRVIQKEAKTYFYIFLSTLMVGSFLHTRSIISARYFGDLFEHLNPNLEGKETFLDDLGIDRKAKIVSLPDPSVNISLYLLRRKGWTDIFEGIVNIQDKINQGADYLILHKKETLDNDSYKPYQEHLVGEKDSVFVFDLKPYRK